MDKHHYNAIGGGLFSFDNAMSFVDKAAQMADPISQLEKAKGDFDSVGPLDKAFSSPRHFAKAALHGYAGNWRVGSAYSKASSIAAAPVAPMGIPLSMAQNTIADKLNDAADAI